MFVAERFLFNLLEHGKHPISTDGRMDGGEDEGTW
jgi:hypothetical protein